MNANELRHRVVSVLLQASEPLTLAELGAAGEMSERQLRAALKALVGEALVVEGKLVAGKAEPQYRWAARWRERAQRTAVDSRQRLLATMAPLAEAHGRDIDIEGAPATTFHDYIVSQYTPPADKRFLVFLQCSVRRPFSSSPSHASMRRAIAAATGFDPGKDFDRCPVHVVVLASKIGPVPYDLEDVYSANVGGAGVKHFRPEHYERTKPILAARMAGYVIAHGRHYKRIATFTEGRYAEVMAEACKACQAAFPILPTQDGPTVVRIGKSTPRKYWEKYWIQLYLEIVNWLPPAARKQAAERLKSLDVAYR